jgi:lipoate-protein ligase A
VGAAPGWARILGDGGDHGEAELGWLDDALVGRPSASVWTGPQQLVVPLSYRRYPGLDGACEASQRRGWPVRMRRSGGGVVPQGPGLLNLSVTCAFDGGPARMADAVYAKLCVVLAAALAEVGIATVSGTVAGSFCDGRFNLAVADPLGGPARKIAGTAQYWRRAGGRHAVLAHALLILDSDTDRINAAVNRFEADAGSGRVHAASTLTSVGQAWSDAHGALPASPDLSDRLRRRIALEVPRHFPTGDCDGSA